ncbi:MAG: c-type cytochrome [Candidatus Acidiferrales bacterium]
MIHSITRSLFLLAVLLFATAGRTAAQDKPMKKAPIEQTSPASGAEMFKTYCAVCHGRDAKGDGPAAADLKVQPPDLTMLAKRHDGKFPDTYVAMVLRNGPKAPAHGTAEMPVWGPLFSSISGGDQAQVNLRIGNLVSYVKSLQVK